MSDIQFQEIVSSLDRLQAVIGRVGCGLVIIIGVCTLLNILFANERAKNE